MKKMFPKIDLVEMAGGDFDEEIYDLISDTLTDTSRWSTHHRMIFLDKSTGKFFESYYSRGATEQQDEYPYEYDGNEIECSEVIPKSVVKIVYETVKD